MLTYIQTRHKKIIISCLRRIQNFSYRKFNYYSSNKFIYYNIFFEETRMIIFTLPAAPAIGLWKNPGFGGKIPDLAEKFETWRAKANLKVCLG